METCVSHMDKKILFYRMRNRNIILVDTIFNGNSEIEQKTNDLEPKFIVVSIN